MTNQLPFWLEYGQGLKHLGLEPKTTPTVTHGGTLAFDLSKPLSARARAQARIYAKAVHSTYVIAAGSGRPFSFEGLVEMQERLMREQFDPQLDKYFPGGEYNGKTELLRPSKQSFLPKRA
jgi:hypothetical protein